LVTDLDPTRRDVVVLTGRPSEESALAAASWLERELRRPIVRHEWDRPDFRHRLWLFADTGEKLVVGDSTNNIRLPKLGVPDKVVPVRRPSDRD
jgi:hypothetical protein